MQTLLIRSTQQHKPCEECERYKVELVTARSIADRRKVGHAYHAHLGAQMSDRRVLGMIEQASWGFFSGHAKSDSASIVIDGMDQAKFRCPRNLPAAKLFADLERPTLHLAGVIVTGHAENYWISDANVKKDANTEVDCVARAIEGIGRHCTENNIAMPKHLNIWAVSIGVFRSITFNYLVKGHSLSGIGSHIPRRHP